MTPNKPSPTPIPPYTTYLFRADTDAIRTCAAEYEILASTKGRLTSYIHKWLQLEFFDATMYGEVRDAVNTAHEKLLSNADRLEVLMSDSGLELENAASLYDHTDQAKAADLDRTYSTTPNTL